MHDHSDNQQALAGRQPWNKGRLIGQKLPLKLKDVWAIRLRLLLGSRVRDLACFNLALDSKLRGCDLVRLRVADVSPGESVMSRATVTQQKTGRPVRFELTEPTREALRDWLVKAQLGSADLLFPSRSHRSSHLSARQYARIVKSWVTLVGLDLQDYATHPLRRTKATLIYRRTKNLRAVQLLRGHTKLESTFSVSWNRGRRCSRDRRADGDVEVPGGEAENPRGGVRRGDKCLRLLTCNKLPPTGPAFSPRLGRVNRSSPSPR